MAKTGIGVRPENRCVAITKKGKPCRAAKVILKDLEGNPIRYRVCLGHLMALAGPAKIRDRHGYDPAKQGGRPPRPNALEVLRHKVEVELGIDKVLQPLIDGLEAKRALVVGNGPHAYVEMVSDIDLSMKASDKLLDRVYGKPRQAMELTGSGGGPISIDVPTDEERAKAVAEMLAMTGGLGSAPTVVNTNGASNGAFSSNGHHNGDDEGDE